MEDLFLKLNSFFTNSKAIYSYWFKNPNMRLSVFQTPQGYKIGTLGVYKNKETALKALQKMETNFLAINDLEDVFNDNAQS